MNTIKREIKVLETLRHGVNIVELLGVVREPLEGIPCIVTEYVQTNGIDSYKLFKTFTDFDIRFYMYELCKTLDFCHSKGIIHKDVKPDNIMIDHPNRKLRLIDWGLADFYFPEAKQDTRVTAKYYKAPELLIEYNRYDYSVDVWALGCTFAGMIFRKKHFFEAEEM